MSPILGCSIEISCDIYSMYTCRSVCLWETHYKKYVCQNAWAELRGPNMLMLDVSFGWLKPTCHTRIIHFDYMLEQL